MDFTVPPRVAQLLPEIRRFVEERIQPLEQRISEEWSALALVHALGAPPVGASLLFCVGRSAGWVAHVQEQRASGELLRPRARYVGPRG